MKLHKFCLMLMAAAVGAIETYPALAGVTVVPPGDFANGLPGPGIFGLVVVGIVAAVGIARRRK